MILGQKQRPRSLIKQGKDPVPNKVRSAIFPPCFPSLQNQCIVRYGASLGQGHTEQLKQFPAIIQPGMGNHHEIPAGADQRMGFINGLRGGMEGQMAQPNRTVRPLRRTIRPPIGHGLGHGFQNPGLHRCAIPIKNPKYATHKPPRICEQATEIHLKNKSGTGRINPIKCNAKIHSQKGLTILVVL